MKVLVVSHSCATAVNQQFYAQLARTTGWEITLVVPAKWRNEYGRVISGERWPGFEGRIIRVPVVRSGDIILHAYRTSFVGLIRSVDPDAIYVNHEPYAVATAQVYAANCLAGRRPIGFYSCQNIRKRYPPPFRWSESWVYCSSDFALPISDTVRAVLEAKGFTGHATVTPLGFDPSVYHPRPDAGEVRRQLGAGPDEPLIGYLGRLVPEKGLDTLLDALATMPEVPWRLALVGSGPHESALRRRAASACLADRISWAGYVPHDRAPAHLSAFDLLVLPSETQPNWREQFGRVVVEAMACGTAVVGSDSGEIPTLLRCTGGGMTFPEGRADALAEILRVMLRDPERRRHLSETGRRAATEQFSHAATAEIVAAALETAVGNRAAERSGGVEPPEPLPVDALG